MLATWFQWEKDGRAARGRLDSKVFFISSRPGLSLTKEIASWRVHYATLTRHFYSSTLDFPHELIVTHETQNLFSG